MKISKRIKNSMLWSVIVPILACLFVIIGCQMAILVSSRGRIYADVDKIPHREVGLLLGTNPLGRTGRPNQFFLRRIDAAAALYKAGKIDRFIISGARQSQWYDEPEAMRKALLNKGLPDNIIILDGEGFHTIASIERAKQVFGVDSLTIISQEFHNERAIFMANHSGVDAIAYNAANTSSRKWKLIMMGRECVSRTKAVFGVLYSKFVK